MARLYGLIPSREYTVWHDNIFISRGFGLIKCTTEGDDSMDKNEFQVGDKVGVKDYSGMRVWKGGQMHTDLIQLYGSITHSSPQFTVLQTEGVDVYLYTNKMSFSKDIIRSADILLMGIDGELIFGTKKFLRKVEKDFSYLVTAKEVSEVKNYQEALDISIKHWKQLSELTEEEYKFIEKNVKWPNIYTGMTYCGLCSLYKAPSEYGCNFCPLWDGENCCKEWGNASEKWGVSLPDFRLAAKALYQKLLGLKNG